MENSREEAIRYFIDFLQGDYGIFSDFEYKNDQSLQSFCGWFTSNPNLETLIKNIREKIDKVRSTEPNILNEIKKFKDMFVIDPKKFKRMLRDFNTSLRKRSVYYYQEKKNIKLVKSYYIQAIELFFPAQYTFELIKIVSSVFQVQSTSKGSIDCRKIQAQEE